MKSSKVDIKAKLTIWSGIALMALALSSGKPVLAAEDIKLWNISQRPTEQTLLLHLKDDADKIKAVDLILGDKPDTTKFVTTYAKEPVQFLEGIQAAWIKVNKAATDSEKAEVVAFKEKIKKELEEVDASKFGGTSKKEVLLKLVKEMLEKDIDATDLIAKAFARATDRLELNISDVAPVVPPVVAPPTIPTTTTTTTVVPPPRTGEQGNDALDRQSAQQMCDAIKGQNKQREQELQALLDSANAILNRRAADSSINPAAEQNKKNEKGLEDILPGLLANALGQDKQEDITPAPNNAQQPLASNRDDRDNDQSAFNQPLPQQNNQQPPFFLPPNTNPGVQTPVRLDLPSNSGQQELRDAQAVTSSNEGRVPISAQLSPYATPNDLIAAKVRTRTDMQKTQIALTNAKDRASKLDEQLEELKDGGRAALSPEVKKQIAQLQSDVDTSKRNYDQQRQMLQMVDAEQRTQLQPMLMSLQQDLNQKEQKLSQFNAQVDVAVEDGSRQIKKLAKVRDSLNSEVNKLNSQLSGIKEDEQAISQLINQNQQLQMAQFQGQNGAVQNVNNGGALQRFPGINNGGPRTLPPSRLGGAFGNRAAGTPANGNVTRGPLTK